MKNILKSISVFFICLTLVNCEEYDAGSESPKTLNYGFNDVAKVIEISELDPVYKVGVFASNISDVDRVVNLTVNEVLSTFTPGDFTFANSVTIPAGSNVGYVDVVFDFDNLELGVDKLLVFDLVNPDDGSVINITRDRISITYAPLCELNAISFEIILDRYGSETSWEITDSSGDVITNGSGGPYTDLAANGLQPVKIFKYCLASGDYTVTVYDSYGDGMVTTAAIIGSFKIKRSNGDVVVDGSGSFADQSSINFTL